MILLANCGNGLAFKKVVEPLSGPKAEVAGLWTAPVSADGFPYWLRDLVFVANHTLASGSAVAIGRSS